MKFVAKTPDANSAVEYLNAWLQSEAGAKARKVLEHNQRQIDEAQSDLALYGSMILHTDADGRITRIDPTTANIKGKRGGQ